MEHAGHVGWVNIVAHERCFDAARVGTQFTRDSSEFSSCAFCGQYGYGGAYPEDSEGYQIRAICDFVEPCDCNGRVMHNNGGNYHHTYYRLISKI